MKRIALELTDELAAAIDDARGKTHRNPAVEDWLWRIKEVRESARRLGLKRPNRPTRGRPKHHAN